MYREPGGGLDLTEALSRGRATLGSGRYETLIHPGSLDGLPMLTFTAPWSIDEVEWNSPSADYVRYLSAGLLQAGAWDAATIAAYVAACPGAAGHWSAREIADLIAY